MLRFKDLLFILMLSGCGLFSNSSGEENRERSLQAMRAMILDRCDQSRVSSQKCLEFLLSKIKPGQDSTSFGALTSNIEVSDAILQSVFSLNFSPSALVDLNCTLRLFLTQSNLDGEFFQSIDDACSKIFPKEMVNNDLKTINLLYSESYSGVGFSDKFCILGCDDDALENSWLIVALENQATGRTFFVLESPKEVYNYLIVPFLNEAAFALSAFLRVGVNSLGVDLGTSLRVVGHDLVEQKPEDNPRSNLLKAYCLGFLAYSQLVVDKALKNLDTKLAEDENLLKQLALSGDKNSIGGKVFLDFPGSSSDEVGFNIHRFADFRAKDVGLDVFARDLVDRVYPDSEIKIIDYYNQQFSFGSLSGTSQMTILGCENQHSGKKSIICAFVGDELGVIVFSVQVAADIYDICISTGLKRCIVDGQFFSKILFEGFEEILNPAKEEAVTPSEHSGFADVDAGDSLYKPATTSAGSFFVVDNNGQLREVGREGVFAGPQPIASRGLPQDEDGSD